MATLATWSRVVESDNVSSHNFNGLATLGLAFSVAHFQLQPRAIFAEASRGLSNNYESVV